MTYADPYDPISPEERAWYELQERHEDCDLGRCAIGAPDECPVQFDLACFECGPRIPSDEATAVKLPVVRRGHVINPADPTQTYVLACGHTTI